MKKRKLNPEMKSFVPQPDSALLQLPESILGGEILSRIRPVDLAYVEKTCKQLNHLAHECWKEKFKQEGWLLHSDLVSRGGEKAVLVSMYSHLCFGCREKAVTVYKYRGTTPLRLCRTCTHEKGMFQMVSATVAREKYGKTSSELAQLYHYQFVSKFNVICRYFFVKDLE